MKVKKILKILFMGVFLFIVTGNVLAVAHKDHPQPEDDIRIDR